MPSPAQYANVLRSYAPNPSQGRGYAANPFAGSSPTQVGAMAPHLSVGAADRPYAADIALLQGSQYASQMPDVNKMWNQAPHRYESSIGKLLGQDSVQRIIAALKDPTQAVGYDPDLADRLSKPIIGYTQDDEASPIYADQDRETD
jgi:hypothetical protein